MKKVSALALAAFVTCSSAFGQEAFKHLGMSLEVGSTGAGVNLSYPVVTNRLVLTVGYNFPSIGISSDFRLNSGSISSQMSQAVGKIESYNNYVANNQQVAAYLGLSPISTSNLQKSIGEVKTDVDAKLNFGAFKAMLEYYPTDKSYFHFTAGVFISDGEWMNISGTADPSVWNTYSEVVSAHDRLQDIIAAHPELKSELSTMPSVNQAAKITVMNKSFAVDPATGKLDVALAVKKIKPYLGVGFGSSVPTKKRMGFQMEVGMYYQGKPTLESSQEVMLDGSAYSDDTLDDVVETIVHFQWYPQLTFRWTGRLF